MSSGYKTSYLVEAEEFDHWVETHAGAAPMARKVEREATEEEEEAVVADKPSVTGISVPALMTAPLASKPKTPAATTAVTASNTPVVMTRIGEDPLLYQLPAKFREGASQLLDDVRQKFSSIFSWDPQTFQVIYEGKRVVSSSMADILRFFFGVRKRFKFHVLPEELPPRTLSDTMPEVPPMALELHDLLVYLVPGGELHKLYKGFDKTIGDAMIRIHGRLAMARETRAETQDKLRRQEQRRARRRMREEFIEELRRQRQARREERERDWLQEEDHLGFDALEEDYAAAPDEQGLVPPAGVQLSQV